MVVRPSERRAPQDDLHNCDRVAVPDAASLARAAAIMPAQASHCRSFTNAVVTVVAAAQDDFQHSARVVSASLLPCQAEQKTPVADRGASSPPVRCTLANERPLPQGRI